MVSLIGISFCSLANGNAGSMISSMWVRTYDGDHSRHICWELEDKLTGVGCGRVRGWIMLVEVVVVSSWATPEV